MLKKLDRCLTELLLPLHETEPLLATQLKAVAQEGKTPWTWWNLPPWALKVTCGQNNGTANHDARHQDLVLLRDGDG